jgi:Ca2+-binding RTX toxin-like protein
MKRIGVAAAAAGLFVSGLAATPARAAAHCFGEGPTIVGDAESNDIQGTTGDDVILALGGHDTVHGMDGDDLICGGSGPDIGLYGDAGNDKIDAGGSERASILYGGEGDDLLYEAPGGGDSQEMFGGPGNDTLKAGDSNGTYDDVLDGGPGNDVMEHGSGPSTFIGGEGDDVMRGGPRGGEDGLLLIAAPGPVEIDLGRGIMRGWGNDEVEEIEMVIGSDFGDTMSGDGERNFFIGGGGGDTLTGRGGDDCLSGGRIRAGDSCGPSQVDAGTGDDDLIGGAGDDLLTGGDGNDLIAGGSGADTTWYTASASAVEVDLGAGTATGDGTDVLSGVEGVGGSRFADVLTGSAGPDVLIASTWTPWAPAEYAGERGDVVNGLGGDDVLDVAGYAIADGGAGSDTVRYSYHNPNRSLIVDLRDDVDSDENSLESIENVDDRGGLSSVIHGDDGPNVLRSGGSDDQVFGHGGDDYLYTLSGRDSLDGGAGRDVLDGGPRRKDPGDTCVRGEVLRDCER